MQDAQVGQPTNSLEMDAMAMVIVLIAGRKAGTDSPGEWAEYAEVRG
jgi:hypothetical protein